MFNYKNMEIAQAPIPSSLIEVELILIGNESVMDRVHLKCQRDGEAEQKSQC